MENNSKKLGKFSNASSFYRLLITTKSGTAYLPLGGTSMEDITRWLKKASDTNGTVEITEYPRQTEDEYLFDNKSKSSKVVKVLTPREIAQYGKNPSSLALFIKNLEKNTETAHSK